MSFGKYADVVTTSCFYIPAFLEKAKKDISDSKQKNKLNGTRPALLRSLFIAGLLCKHFDFDKHMNQDKKVSFNKEGSFTAHSSTDLLLLFLLMTFISSMVFSNNQPGYALLEFNFFDSH